MIWRRSVTLCVSSSFWRSLSSFFLRFLRWRFALTRGLVKFFFPFRYPGLRYFLTRLPSSFSMRGTSTGSTCTLCRISRLARLDFLRRL